MKPAKRPELQVCVIAEDGEVIARIFDDCAALAVRSAEREEKAEVTLTYSQVQALCDVLQRTPGDGDLLGDDD